LLYFRLALLTPCFSAYFIRDCLYFISCVILVMRKSLPFWSPVWCGKFTLLLLKLFFSLFLFFLSSVQYLLYSYIRWVDAYFDLIYRPFLCRVKIFSFGYEHDILNLHNQWAVGFALSFLNRKGVRRV
jgi:hypothetical protein